MISAALAQHFDTFGFLVIRSCFDAGEMARLAGEFDEVLREDRGGVPFDERERQAVFGLVERRPDLFRLVEDDRIYEPLEQFLGPDFVWSASDGNYWVGDTQWHPDRFDRTWPLVKASFYLGTVTRDTGCLRVIPGSHRTPLHESLRQLWRTRLAQRVKEGAGSQEELDSLFHPGEDRDAPPFGIPGPDVPCHAIETEPGDLIYFHQNLWHASFGGRAGRRQLAMSFGANPVTPDQVTVVRELHATNLNSARERGNVSGDRLYVQRFMETDSPRIKRMVARLAELGLR